MTSQIVRGAVLGVALMSLESCAPVAPVPPPPFGPALDDRLGWILAVGAIAFGIAMWRKINNYQDHSDRHLSEAINELNQRLRRLEKQLETRDEKEK